MGLTEEKRVLKVRSSKAAVSSNENVIISFCVAFKRKISSAHSFPSVLPGPFLSKLLSLLLPPFYDGVIGGEGNHCTVGCESLTVTVRTL